MENGNLNEVEVAKLLGVYRHEGYQVLLDMLEFICTEAENDFISTHPIDKEKILASHAIMYAQREMFEKFQARASAVAARALGEEPKKELTRQDRVNRILNMDGSDQQ